ncbi:hypothetical protein [Paenibacillus sp. FSL L8-0709]|uniref:hypothetical protein n=1 Tax=Paenibacillus sp. FSL L8-0709 TaxID=2975312 RepID=UPI0030F7F54B
MYNDSKKYRVRINFKLSVEGEMKMLRIFKRRSEHFNKEDSSTFCKIVVDDSISEMELKMNHGLLKYCIKINPIKDQRPYLCIILLETHITGMPFSRRRKAIVSIDNELILRKLIEKEFIGNDNFYVEFGKPKFVVYPDCMIQKVDFSQFSTINFSEEKQLIKWIKPIERGISKYLKYGIR